MPGQENAIALRQIANLILSESQTKEDIIIASAKIISISKKN